MRYLRVLFGLALALGWNGPLSAETPGAAAATDKPGVACNELNACLTAFRQDLERLRLIMGKPPAQPLNMGIHSGAPHDIYFLTRVLLRRTNRLGFELLRVVEKPLGPPDDVQPGDALALTQQAYQTLKEILADPLIAASAAGLPPSPGVSSEPAAMQVQPISPFDAIVTIDRQLNLLLERQYLSSDVYMEVTLAIAYAARLLAYYNQPNRLPEEPPFEPAKQPGDVYRRLLACLESISRIYSALGVEASTVNAWNTAVTGVAPGDVTLLASLVVAQLDFLQRHLGVDWTPRQTFYPGLKFPAHVYQRVGLLQSQLQQLEQAVAARRD